MFVARLIILLAMVLTASATPSVAAPPLNIILIMADDIAYDNNFGAYGAKDSWTPRLDRMATEGIRFDHCYSTPKCTPSRVKIMTGRSGVRNYFRFGALRADEPTFATMLQKAGYATMIAGKWQLDGPGGTPTKAAGFDSWLLWNTQIASGDRFWNPTLEHNGQLMHVATDAYGPDLCVDAITSFIERHRQSPFFVYYPMLLVHSPFLPTPLSVDRNETDKQKNFADMVQYMDLLVGRIMDCVREQGLEQQTVVMFTTDNGTNRNLRYVSRGREVEGKKGVPHDRGTHAPLLIRCPGTIGAGQVCQDLVDFSDFLPTLAEISGATLPRGPLDGRSFWPQCRGLTGTPREWIYQYYWPKGYGWIPDELGEGELIWAQNRRYKLYGNGLFYDLLKDPEELRAIPVQLHTAAEQEAARLLNAAIGSMPAGNPAYDGQPARSGR